METTKELKELLSEVTTISKNYDEIAKTSGENFNIFSIMSMESDERYTHSAIIGELLNPKGSHGQGSIFLKLFIDEIEPLKKWDNFEYESAVVIIEEHLGKIDEEYSRGGFIDIVIKSGNKTIIIENKIYAPEQKNQLQRYKYHYRECECVLLYLNLSGISPTEYGIGKLIKEDFHIISYKNEILKWLEKCIIKANNLLIIRETITQYIYLIKKLTNQTTNNKMSEEITNTMKNSIKESFEIVNNIEKLKNTLYCNFMSLIKDFAQLNEMNVNETFLNVDKEYGLYLTSEYLKELKIGIIFNDSNYTDLYYGIFYIDKLEFENRKRLIEKFKELNYETNEELIWKLPKNNNWFNNPDIWDDIAKGVESDTYKEITQGITEIIKIEKINFED